MWLYGPLNETAPAGVDPSFYHQSRQPLIIGVDSFYICLVTSAVTFRFVSRHISGTGFGLDDWLTLLSVPFSITPSIIDLIQLSNGMGRHMIVDLNTNPQLITQYARNLYVVLFFYNPGLAFFKWAMLAYYCRIFSMCRWLRRTAIVLSVLIGMWAVTIQVFHIFRCSPIEEQWIPGSGTCVMSRDHYYYMQSIPSIIFDAVILVLPIRLVWQIQLPKYTRMGVLLVFMLGGLVTIISIVRLGVLVTMKHSSDLLWDFIDLCMWSDAESTAGILSSCLLTYGPLFRVARRKVGMMTEKTFSSFYSSSSKRSNLSSGSRELKSGPGSFGTATYVSRGSDGDSDRALTKAEIGGGQVEEMGEIGRLRLGDDRRWVHVKYEVRID